MSFSLVIPSANDLQYFAPSVFKSDYSKVFFDASEVIDKYLDGKVVTVSQINDITSRLRGDFTRNIVKTITRKELSEQDYYSYQDNLDVVKHMMESAGYGIYLGAVHGGSWIYWLEK